MLPADLHAVVADAAGAAAADMLDVAAVADGSGAQPVQMGASVSIKLSCVLHMEKAMLPDIKCCSCCWLSCETDTTLFKCT